MKKTNKEKPSLKDRFKKINKKSNKTNNYDIS